MSSRSAIALPKSKPKTAKIYENLLSSLKEFELALYLSPKLTKSQLKRLKLTFNQIVKGNQ
jgi:hypothetical protein